MGITCSCKQQERELPLSEKRYRLKGFGFALIFGYPKLLLLERKRGVKS